MKKITYTIISALLLAAGGSEGAMADEQVPVVLELFTSQGCSSCPAADALLQELAKDPGIVALSFHVHYWDSLGWRDPFSSAENTNRQNQYAKNLNQNSVFTPQLIVGGTHSTTGNDKAGAIDAIAAAHRVTRPIPITFTPVGEEHVLNVHIGAVDPGTLPSSIFVVRYRRHASTEVPTGENAGRTLDSINNVMELSKYAAWENKDVDFQLPISQNIDEGIAVFIQHDGQGRIISAQNFPK